MRTLLTRWLLLPLGLALPACGDNGVGDNLEPGTQAAIAMVLGDNQIGKAGRELALPLVVRVTDVRGDAVPNIPVSWSVTSGEGVLQGLWEDCDPSGDQRGDPLPTASTSTNADGIAWVTFMPTAFALTTVAAAPAGFKGPPVIFTTDSRDPGATLSIVSGNDQEGNANEWLGEPLMARVTDGQGNGVAHVAVSWQVVSGAGGLAGYGCSRVTNPASTIVRTGADGLTWIPDVGVSFYPRAFGISTIAATAAGVQGSPVTFTVNATVMSIHLIPADWFPAGFYPSGVTVPVGARVEFVNWFPMARITSTSVPTGGVPFDSGTLAYEGRFQFVPGVAGTWGFTDQVSGLTGSLTVR